MGLEKISDMRKDRGLSLDELSERSGVPKGTLSKISAGITKNPSIDTIKAIVHSMGFTLDDLDETPTKAVPKHDEDLLKKYHSLDHHGKEVVDTILNIEYERINSGGNTAEIQKTDAVPHRASGLDLITTQEEIEAELEAYRRELELERKGAGESSALPNTKHA